LGWYTPSISHEPALFTSILPAWNDRNLLHLTAKIKSNCFFAHVRAASTGGVNPYNCHPFILGRWMLMHNGNIADFVPVKRHLRRLLDDEIYNWIKGETDSEHFFALLIQTAQGRDLNQSQVIADTIRETIQVVNGLVKKYSKHQTSFFNFCLTDGKRLFATRYCSNKNTTPETLHYFSGQTFKPHRNRHNEALQGKQQSVLIASEKLTKFQAEWQNVPANHMLIVDEDLTIRLESI
jgi:glutamine amidotransferase